MKTNINPEDAQYTDILIACTLEQISFAQFKFSRSSVSDLSEMTIKQANSTPLKNWIKSRWQDLIDLALTEIKVEECQIRNGRLD
jgi:hypothetical protein